MALDATVAGESANSYVTVTEADTYLANHLEGETWNSKSTAEKERLLITATRQIDSLRIKDEHLPYDDNQALKFPRSYDTDDDGNPEIPQAVKDAVCEQAVFLLTSGTGRSKLQQAGVSDMRLGDMSESYVSLPDYRKVLSPEAARLIAPYIRLSGRIVCGRT
jgi:hypothetical protein